MKTTWIKQSAMWIFVGALAACSAPSQAEESPTDPKLTMAAPSEFVDSGVKNFKSLVLPKPDCNTKEASDKLQEQVKARPDHKFDGVSPWPGLFGVWMHQQAGIYARITGKYSNEEEKNVRKRMLTIKVDLRDLCNHELVGQGETSVDSAKLPITNLRVALGKHALNRAVRPVMVISQVGDVKTQKSLDNVIGLTLQYKVRGSEEGADVKESILLRNVLNP